MDGKPLSLKQQAFVDEYLKDRNGTQAAIRAGYSPHTANEQAARLLAKASIKQAIEAKTEIVSEKAEVDATWVLVRLKANAERAAQAEPVRDKEGNETGEYRYEGGVVNKALELIGKHIGFFPAEVGSKANPLHVKSEVGVVLTHETRLARIAELARREAAVSSAGEADTRRNGHAGPGIAEA